MAIRSPGQAKTLAPDQIIGIIEACAANDVATLKYGDFEISRGSKPSQPVDSVTPVTPSGPPAHRTNPPVAEMTDKQHAEQTADAIEQDELNARELQIAELLVTDPLAAERMMGTGELQDADNESGNEQ